MSTQAHTVSVRKGVNIEIASIIWMIIEAAVAIGAGIAAHSLALTAFGADSIIELVAGAVLLWRLTIEVTWSKSCSGQTGREIFVMGCWNRFIFTRCLYRCRIH